MCSVHTNVELQSYLAENSGPLELKGTEFTALSDCARGGRGQSVQLAVHSPQPSQAELEASIARDGALRTSFITAMMKYLGGSGSTEGMARDGLAELLQARRHPPSSLVPQWRLESQSESSIGYCLGHRIS